MKHILSRVTRRSKTTEGMGDFQRCAGETKSMPQREETGKTPHDVCWYRRKYGFMTCRIFLFSPQYIEWDLREAYIYILMCEYIGFGSDEWVCVPVRVYTLYDANLLSGILMSWAAIVCCPWGILTDHEKCCCCKIVKLIFSRAHFTAAFTPTSIDYMYVRRSRII